MRKWALKEGNTQSGDQNDFIQTRIKTKIAQCFDYKPECGEFNEYVDNFFALKYSINKSRIDV